MIRKAFKWGFRLAGLLAVALAVLIVGHNTILRLLLENRLKNVTGLETTVGRVRVEWTRPVVRLSHVRLFNPPVLGGKPFLDIPEARVTYDFTELFSQRFRVRELRVSIEEIRLVRQGSTLSTQALLASYRRKASPVGASLVDPLVYAGVDRLVLSADRYIYQDYFEPLRAQDLFLRVREVSVDNLRAPADWVRLWKQAAQAKGIAPPPLAGPTAHASSPAASTGAPPVSVSTNRTAP